LFPPQAHCHRSERSGDVIGRDRHKRIVRLEHKKFSGNQLEQQFYGAKNQCAAGNPTLHPLLFQALQGE
jgi:hypothetical protein